MTDRAMLVIVAQDESGEDLEGATVAFTKEDGTALTQSLYSVAAGGSPVVVHTTDSLGRLTRYVPIGERVQVTVNGGTAWAAQFDWDPADVVVNGITTPVTINGYSSNDDWALTVKNSGSQSKAFRVLNDGGDAVLRVQQDATGVNDLVSINLLDSSLPTTSLLHVARAITTTGFSVGRFVGDVTAAAISGTAVTGEVTANVASAGNATALAATASRSTGAAQAITRGVVATISSQVAGTGTSNVGFHATSVAHSGGSSVTNDAGLLVDGAVGWTLPILVVDTNGSTVLFRVDSTGGILGATTAPRTTNTYNLGATSLVWANTFTGILTLGTANPASAGTVRMPNNTAINFRNAANGADLNLIKSDASNNVVVGATSGSDGAYLAGTASVNLQVGANVELTANATGISVGRAAGQVGFYASAGVVKSAALTQTYATADRTHANPTATVLTAASGTADGTVDDVGGAFNQTTLNNNFQECAARINQLIADVADTKQFLNSVVDDLQAVNLVG